MRNTLYYPAGLSQRPLYSTLVQFPAAAFVGTLITDYAYWRTTENLWASFSVWLLAAGCVAAGVAGVVGLLTFLFNRGVREARLAAAHAGFSIAAALAAVFNAFVHSRDGYTSVVPTGLTLSIIVVVLMLIVRALGWSSPVRHTVAGEAA